jgi:hypothetical protein
VAAGALDFLLGAIGVGADCGAWHRASGQKRSNLKKAFFSFFL